jgi:transcription elongation factor GreA
MKRVPLTQQGAEMLRQRLHALKTHERPQIIIAIAEARAHGDLKENAEYHAAREQQGFIEGKITALENALAVAEIIDVTKLPRNGRVVFGVTVTLMQLDTNEEITYRVVGEEEADVKQHRLSIGAPLARAMIGKEAGDRITLPAQTGSCQYEILEVQYLP